MAIPADRRRPNTMLRSIRLSLHLSQNEFARAVRRAGETLGEPNGCTKRLVQKWESGEHTVCRPHYRRSLEQVTRRPYGQLGFADGDQIAESVSLCAPIASVPQIPSPVSGKSIVHTDEAGERLRYALEEPYNADPGTVSLLEVTTSRLFDLEHHERAAVLLPTVERHLDQTAALLAGTQRQPLRHRLTLIGGQTAALAGMLALDQGDAQNANRYLDAAIVAAQKAGSGLLLACVLTYLSASAAERGDPMTAWQLAHTAVSHAGGEDRARAWMSARAAQEAAELGEVSAALTELESVLKVAKTLRPALPGEDTPPWVRFVDSAYLYGMVANVHSRLNRRADACEAAQRAVNALGQGRTKARALTLAEVAYTAASVGDTKRAMHYAAEALELAETLEATQALRRLRALIRVLPKPLSVEARRLAGRVAPNN